MIYSLRLKGKRDGGLKTWTLIPQGLSAPAGQADHGVAKSHAYARDHAFFLSFFFFWLCTHLDGLGSPLFRDPGLYGTRVRPVKLS